MVTFGDHTKPFKNNFVMKRFIIYFFFGLFLTSCEFMEPLPIQDQTTEDLWIHATYGEGILNNAYTRLSGSFPVDMDYYTDNAVPSVPGTNRLALGGWSVVNSPIGNWENSYNAIKYLNIYIANGENLVYSVDDPVKDSILQEHRIGEAYYLRAWYEWQLLQAYAGFPDNGSVALGFPIVTTVLEPGDDLDIPRNTYEECVQQIAKDCDVAMSILPNKYDQAKDPFYGLGNRGRASGLAAKTLKARVYLYAASPAYGNSTQATWQRAAEAAYVAIEAAGGLTDLIDFGNFNDAASFDNIWIQPTYSSNFLEQRYYPPSLYGNGQCNPSQNLVDAFPASDGFPIGLSSIYNPSQPYDNRDNRFNSFIFHNNEDYNGTIIQTFEGGTDAPGGLNQQGTRTGYYMKKFLSKKVKLTPGRTTSDIKLHVYLGKTELYLNFAEAANEAFGPENSTLGISAVEAIKVIRKRAGIDSDSSTEDYDDAYLQQQASAGKDAFRAFIHQNRRLELCFEGHRFWDIRRLNQPLNHTVKGVKITRSGENFTYNYVTVEEHFFQDYMRYAPLPYSQTLVMKNLEQNKGW